MDLKKFLLSFILISSLLIIFPASSSQASLITSEKKQDFTRNFTLAAIPSYIESHDLNTILIQLIQLVLSVLGVIFILLLFLAGNDWLQAAGNEEKVTKSKEVIRNTLIGLAIVLVAYAMSSGFGGVLKNLVK